mgnify:FL=1|jgi:uncharacterized membrane protein|tara:strand:+ start:4103 stop:6277 length:2175 start_codon:yes stop_codon:yes gene_type:complete
MQRFWQSLTLCAFALLVLATPSQAEEFADVEIYFDKVGFGDTYELTTEEPTSEKPKYWKAYDEPGQENSFYPLVSWEMNLGGPINLGDSLSYTIWVESTNVQEIRFKTTLFISTSEGMSNISVDEVTKTSGFGTFLSRNYTLELESSSLDTSDFPAGVPAYTTIGFKLETSVTWAPDTDNRTAWIKAASSRGCGNDSGTVACDSSFMINVRHVEIADDYLGYFSNDRVEEMGADSLFIKVNVSNALGAVNLDSESANIEIQGISNGGKFQNSIIVKDKHTYAKYIQGTWYYQEDQNIVTGIYEIEFSIKDAYGNMWTATLDYELVVDEYGLEIEFSENYSPSGQLPKGGKVDFEFLVYNRGNTRDIFTIELDDTSLPSNWEATLTSQSSLDIGMDLYNYVQVKIEAPVSASGGSNEYVNILVTSTSNSAVSESIKLDATVRTYGVVFLSPPDKINIDPEDFDIDGYYYFSINLRNTGSDKDTYRLEATTARSDWSIRIEIDGIEISAVTIDKSQTQKIDLVLRPLNYENSLGDSIGLLLTADSISPGDGSATLSSDLIIDIPLDRISDLAVNIEDVSINGKPISLLTEDDLSSTEPIEIRLTVYNNGGKSTVPFGIKLYAGQKVVDEYKLEQGISGFGNEPVILTWSNPSSGFTLLKVKVDFEQAVSESIYSLSDNSLDIRLTVSEQTTNNNNGENTDSSLLPAPGYLSTLLVLMAVTILGRKK